MGTDEQDGPTGARCGDHTGTAAPSPSRRRRPTVTARFGSGRRESHDATAFYDRFVAPDISADEVLKAPAEVDALHCGSAADMSSVETSSVALVVTSPPYLSA